jgi:transposase
MAAYHLEIQTHRKKPYGVIRTSYREDGKVKHDNLCRLTGLTVERLRQIQAALQGKTVMKDLYVVTSSAEYGASFACVGVLRALGLHKAIYSQTGKEWVRACVAMIAGRIVYAGSKLSLSQCGEYSDLWNICGIEGEVDVDTHCYEAMDKLLERKDAIQKALADKHLTDGTLVMYDITSSYFEGEYSESELVEFGYNRDKKRGHEQIVISLLCTKEGCPIAVDVLRGNTKDETTVVDKINEIRDKFGIKNIVFVGDRGMVTSTVYDKINHDTVKIISALNHKNIQALCDKGIVQLSMFDEKNILEVVNDGLRYCLCKNPLMAKKETNTRNALIAKTKTELDKIISSKRNGKYSKEMRAGKVVNKYNMGKFIKFIGKDDNLSYSFDEELIRREQLLDGCYVIYTDVNPAVMTAMETVENYKNLLRAEQAFRNMKTVRLELRPVYHKKDDRIIAHVFICMLAYYVMWHMKQKLQPLFDSDGEGKNREYSFDNIIEILKSIRKENIEFMGENTFIITKHSNKQRSILKHLEL